MSTPRLSWGLTLHRLAYAGALVASAVWFWGSTGWLFGGFVLLFWACVFMLRFWETIAVILLTALLVALLLPAAQQARNGPIRHHCRNNLHFLALALHNYHDVHGSFPPAFIADEQGRPMHSWRVLLLPYIDESELYEQYDFSEPWDGPHNRSLIERMPFTYYCPSEAGSDRVKLGCTSYVAVTDERTAWPGAEVRELEDFTDGLSDTLLLIEENGEEIPWTEPRDLTEEKSFRSMTDTSPDTWHGHRFIDDSSAEERGRFVAFADGAVSYLPHGGDADSWRSLARLDDGSDDARRWIGRKQQPKRFIRVRRSG